jgi:plastocyanin
MTRALALVALLALGAPAAAAAAERSVHTHGNTFMPRRVNIVVNDTVRWTNPSLTDHNLHATDPVDLFNGPLNRRSYWTPATNPFTSATPAEVRYACTIHPSMLGTVAVWNLWLEQPVAATWGGTGKLTGLAQGEPHIIAQRWNAAEDEWESLDLATVTASPDGTYTRPVPAEPGRYRTFDGTHTSRQVTLSVKAKLTITKTKIRRGLWSVSAKAQPNQGGANLILDRKKGFGWVKLASKTAGAASKAVFRVKIPDQQLRLRVRLKNPRGGYSPATSASFLLKR